MIDHGWSAAVQSVSIPAPFFQYSLLYRTQIATPHSVHHHHHLAPKFSTQMQNSSRAYSSEIWAKVWTTQSPSSSPFSQFYHTPLFKPDITL